VESQKIEEEKPNNPESELIISESKEENEILFV
jgi:hypothetical protein